MNSQQLSCIKEVVPLDSAPSSVHLHLSDQLIFVYTRTQVLPLQPARHSVLILLFPVPVKVNEASLCDVTVYHHLQLLLSGSKEKKIL